VLGGGGAAALEEAVQKKSKTEHMMEHMMERKSCRPSELAAFLRSAGTWRGGAGGREPGAGQDIGGAERRWMEQLKKESCVPDKMFHAWFPADAELMEVESAAGGASASDGESAGWERVRSCCRALGVSAAEWAAVVEVNDGGSAGGDAVEEEAEAFEKADKDLTSLVVAAAAAGGREMLAGSCPIFSKVNVLVHLCCPVTIYSDFSEFQCLQARVHSERGLWPSLTCRMLSLKLSLHYISAFAAGLHRAGVCLWVCVCVHARTNAHTHTTHTHTHTHTHTEGAGPQGHMRMAEASKRVSIAQYQYTHTHTHTHTHTQGAGLRAGDLKRDSIAQYQRLPSSGTRARICRHIF
jgi:hypothetical protein